MDVDGFFSQTAVSIVFIPFEKFVEKTLLAPNTAGPTVQSRSRTGVRWSSTINADKLPPDGVSVFCFVFFF